MRHDGVNKAHPMNDSLSYRARKKQRERNHKVVLKRREGGRNVTSLGGERNGRGWVHKELFTAHKT